jgi:hypothetical protein
MVWQSRQTIHIRIEYSGAHSRSVFRGRHDIDSHILQQRIQPTRSQLDKQDQMDYRYQVVSASHMQIHLPSLISLEYYIGRTVFPMI